MPTEHTNNPEGGINIKLISSKSTKDNKPTKNGQGKSTDRAAKNRKSGKVAFLIIIPLFLIAAALFVFAGIKAGTSTTIYPNISIYGVDLGGMTQEQAKAALEAPDIDIYAGKIVSINFPADITLQIDAENAGLCIDAGEIAKRAYEYGRSESFLSNTVNYIRCVLSSKSLSRDKMTELNEKYIKDLVAETARRVNAELLENSLKIDDNKITIIKGYGSVLVDDDDVYRLIKDAFLQMNFEPVNYTPPTQAPEEINLEDIKKVVFVEAKNAEYDEEFNVSQDVTGVHFDEVEAQRQLNLAKPGDKIVIPLIFTEPEFTKEYLESLIFRDILYAKTTQLTSNETRSKNIELASNALDGTVLYPGDEFCFNEVVGERTPEKGYGKAAAYLNGEVVQETGGGICQVSSTIYYCVLYADLEVVYRTYHMYPSAYLPLGMDATVSWGGPDFKFKNNTEYPIKIHAWRDGYTCNVELYGTKLDDNYVSMEYVVTEVIPPKTVYKENPNIAPGETKLDQYGSNGYKVNTYKYRYDGDGNLISKTYEDYSSYKPHDEIYLVAPGELYHYVSPPPGTVTPTPFPSPSPSVDPDPSPTVTPTPPLETEDPPPSPTSEITPSPDPEESPEPSESPEPPDDEEPNPT
ncbi:MAG: hypothetical protein GX111_12225 [Clostridiales bacterium]|nr:hypothetical protein [Clostridiales bacterium]